MYMIVSCKRKSFVIIYMYIPMEVDRGEVLDEIVMDEIVVDEIVADVGVVCVTVGVDSDVGPSIWHPSLLPTAKFAM